MRQLTFMVSEILKGCLGNKKMGFFFLWYPLHWLHSTQQHFPKLQLDLGTSKIYGYDIHKQECLTSYGTQDNWFKPKKHWVMLCYSVLAQVKPTPSYHRGMTFAVMQMLCQLLPDDLQLKKGGIIDRITGLRITSTWSCGWRWSAEIQ